MTIHFAAAEGRRVPGLGNSLLRARVALPANDNAGQVQARQGALRRVRVENPAPEPEVLHAALRQFAKHGIGAAEHARNQAERAFFAGDRSTYRWWLGVCRALDRRMAAILARRAEKSGGPG